MKFIDLKERDLFNYMTSRRFDILTPMEEAGFVPPVAFESKDLLLEWVKRHGLETSRIGKIKPANALLVGEKLHPFEGSDYFLYYTQIWVSAKYRGYRLALKNDIKGFVDNPEILCRVDADHVANKNSASGLDDVWINLLPVWSGVNRGFGWIESRLPKLEKGFGKLDISPLVFFKILKDKIKIADGDSRTKEMILEYDINKVVDGLLIHDEKPECIKNKILMFREKIREDVRNAYRLKK